MPKKIMFDNCKDCPIGHDGFLGKNSISYIELGSRYNGHKAYRIILDGKKPEDCPYPDGILVENCGSCPYVKDNYDFFCPEMKEGRLIRVLPKEIHKDCPLDGYDDSRRK